MDELNLQDTPQEDTAQEDTAQTQNHPVIPGASCPEPPEMADALLCCQDLSKHYGGKQALAQINLTLPQGKIIGLLG
ncbi:MAG: hypothetical protein RR051_07070, partial [Clostridiales bacterium]